MKILVVHGRVRNLGDRAIAQCMARQLRSAFPDCELVYDADEPEAMREHLPDAKIVPSLVDVRRVKQVGRAYSWRYFWRNGPYLSLVAAKYLYFWACAVLGLGGSLVASVREYRTADMVVWAGGDYVSDVYGLRFRLRLLELHLAKMMGKTVVLYAMTVGPFRDQRSSLATARALSAADLVLARDQGTFDLLARAGVTANVRRTADCVLLLKPRTSPAALAAIERLGIDGRTIGFAPIAGLYVGLAQSDYQAYEQGLAGLVRDAVAGGRRTVLIAATTEDLDQCRAMERKYGLGVGILDALAFEPDEVKAILGRFGLIVSSRMHPVIIGTGAGTPVLGINRLFKMKEYLAMIGLEKYHLPLAPFDAARAKELMAELEDRNAEVRGELAAGLARAVALSESNIEHVRRLWAERPGAA